MGRGSTESIELEVERFALDGDPVISAAAAKKRFIRAVDRIHTVDRGDRPDSEIEAAVATARELLEAAGSIDPHSAEAKELASALLIYGTEIERFKESNPGVIREQLRYLARANFVGSGLIVRQSPSEPHHLRSDLQIAKTICGRGISSYWSEGDVGAREFCGRCFETATRSFPAAAQASRDSMNQALQGDPWKAGMTEQQYGSARLLLSKAFAEFLIQLPYGEIVTSTAIAHEEMWRALTCDVVREALYRLGRLPERDRLANLLCGYRKPGMSQMVGDSYYRQALEKDLHWLGEEKMRPILTAAMAEAVRVTRYKLGNGTDERYFLQGIVDRLAQAR